MSRGGKMSTQLKTIKIKSDKPIVIITAEEYEGMKETIELLSQNPNLPAELRREREKMEKGDYITLRDYKKRCRIKSCTK
jgi:PHD/YefM family antitoxin component YafN of YafNO toxin-antitoxin module